MQYSSLHDSRQSTPQMCDPLPAWSSMQPCQPPPSCCADLHELNTREPLELFDCSVDQRYMDHARWRVHPRERVSAQHLGYLDSLLLLCRTQLREDEGSCSRTEAGLGR